MRRLLITFLLLGSLSAAFATDSPKGSVVKLLPLFLNKKGQDAISPSLYDRDAYQMFLRTHTNEISAMRFAVLWRASNVTTTNLTLRVEVRGIGHEGMPSMITLQQTVAPHFFRHWTSLPLEGDAYKNFGQVVAWRATIWSDNLLIGEQDSFLW